MSKNNTESISKKSDKHIFNGELDYFKVKNTIDRYQKDPKYIVTSNAFQSMDFNKLVLNNRVFDKINHIFSDQIDDDSKVDVKIMNQESAGLCWICAGMTMCRRFIIKKMKLCSDFNFSLNYLLFWDKLEKCNYFMNFIIDNREKKLRSSAIEKILHSPIYDGGYWHSFVDLVNKYGMIPDSVYKRRVSSKNTGSLNRLLAYKMREFASLIMSPNNVNSSNCDINKIKTDFMNIVTKILIQIIGNPIYPDTKFEWTYKTKSGNKKMLTDLTPMKFYKEYCDIDFNDYVLIVNDPRPRHPFGKLYELQSTIKIVRDKSVTRDHYWYNLDNDEIMKLVIKQIDEKIPVWFGCDVGKYSNHKLNILDIDLYNYGLPFDTSFTTMSKADRIDFHDSNPTHAMAIIGYDTKNKSSDNSVDTESTSSSSDESEEDSDVEIKKITTKTIKTNTTKTNTTQPTKQTDTKKSKKRKKIEETNVKQANKKDTLDSLAKVTTNNCNKLENLTKFQVENSWGENGDTNGLYSMTIDWFKQYGFEVVINKKFLSDEQKSVLCTKPIKLKLKDPLAYMFT